MLWENQFLYKLNSIVPSFLFLFVLPVCHRLACATRVAPKRFVPFLVAGFLPVMIPGKHVLIGIRGVHSQTSNLILLDSVDCE